MGQGIEYAPSVDENTRKEHEKEFSNFIKLNKSGMEKLKKKFPKATKAGIQDIVFLLWLINKDKKNIGKVVFDKANRLLGTLFTSGWINMLSAFKLIGDFFK